MEDNADKKEEHPAAGEENPAEQPKSKAVRMAELIGKAKARQTETFRSKNRLAILAIVFLFSGWCAFGLFHVTFNRLEVMAYFAFIMYILSAYISVRLMFVKGSSRILAITVLIVALCSIAAAVFVR
jgi:ABC-type multidrug transport system permease subunit